LKRRKKALPGKKRLPSWKLKLLSKKFQSIELRKKKRLKIIEKQTKKQQQQKNVKPLCCSNLMLKQSTICLVVRPKRISNAEQKWRKSPAICCDDFFPRRKTEV